MNSLRETGKIPLALIETEEIRRIYEGIRLPARATAGSAGYDLYTPVAMTIRPGETIKIPTGIRVEMNDGWVLAVFPRSSLGFKSPFTVK